MRNVASSRALDWACPLELSTGRTQDISKFRFHLWEPIWYYEKTKTPRDSWKPGRWLGFATGAGDEMTYYIETERGKGKNVVLIRSTICTRRKFIGTEREHTNDDPDKSDEIEKMKLTFKKIDMNIDDSDTETNATAPLIDDEESVNID